jgi:ABC-type Co2+ transport system permease subunit
VGEALSEAYDLETVGRFVALARQLEREGRVAAVVGGWVSRIASTVQLAVEFPRHTWTGEAYLVPQAAPAQYEAL